MNPRPRQPQARAKDRYKHPLESLLDAIGTDPALASERKQIEEYVERSLRAKSGAEPERRDIAAARLEYLISEAREEISTTYLLGYISERDKEWLQVATPVLQILGSLPDSMASGMRSSLVQALIVGAYARLAPDALVDEMARARLKKFSHTLTAIRRRRRTSVRRDTRQTPR